MGIFPTRNYLLKVLTVVVPNCLNCLNVFETKLCFKTKHIYVFLKWNREFSNKNMYTSK